MTELRKHIYGELLATIALTECHNEERLQAWRLLAMMVKDDIENDSQALLAVAKAILEAARG